MITKKSGSAPTQFRSLDFNSYYISRVLANFALIKIGSVSNLRSAKALMRRTAARIPGAYLVFDGRTRRVLSKLTTKADCTSVGRQLTWRDDLQTKKNTRSFLLRNSELRANNIMEQPRPSA